MELKLPSARHYIYKDYLYNSTFFLRKKIIETIIVVYSLLSVFVVWNVECFVCPSVFSDLCIVIFKQFAFGSHNS